MAQIVYTTDATTQDVYAQALVSGNLVCQLDQTANRARTFAFTYTPSGESKTLRTGDKVHSVPFTGVYTEVKPMTGRFDVIHRSIYGTSGSFAYCEDKTGLHCQFSADIGFYARSPSSAPAPPANGALQLALKKQADTKALADLRRSMYNAPLIIGERKETIDMLKRKGLQIASAVRYKQTADLERWLKSRSRDKRRLAKDIAGEHLAFLFGFLPLISEIEGICAALAGDTPTKITGRGRASNVIKSSINTTNGVGKSSIAVYPNALVSIKTTKMTRFSHRTSISGLITMSGAQYARDAGFNPLATVYDLVPLSFLSDFVSNLGTFIRALDPLIGVEFLTGSSTSWVENRTDVKAMGYSQTYRSPNGSDPENVRSNTTSGVGECYARYLRVDRAVLTAYPDPSLMLVNNMSLAKLGTIASLAIQRYLKPVRRLLSIKAFRYKGPRPKYLPPIKYR